MDGPMKTVDWGEPLPVGPCRIRQDGSFRFRLPLFIWFGRHYRYATDEYVYAWKELNVLLRHDDRGWAVRFGWREMGQ
jgi:hypothetical protein